MAKARLRGFKLSRLRELRAEHKLTQAELATALGVAVTSVQNWEAGAHEPDPVAGRRLASIFRVQLAELVDVDTDTCLLADLRSLTGKSQAEAAVDAGWSPVVFGRTERGERSPDDVQLDQLAKLYGVDRMTVAAAFQRTAAARKAAIALKIKSPM